MRHLLPRNILPSLRSRAQLPEGARIEALGVTILSSHAGAVAVHGPTGTWAYLTDAERALFQALDGRTVSSAAEATGQPHVSVLKFARQLWLRGLVSAGGVRAVEPGALAADIEGANQRFILTLLLNKACNLACTYCYLGHEQPKPATLMETTVAESAIDRAMARPEGRILIDFGEVAVAERLFIHLVDYARRAADKAGKSLEMAIQTNGTTLDRELIALLRAERIFVGLSLDGPKELNDRARRYHGGQGAYDRIVAGLRRLGDAEIPHMVIATIARHNVECPEEVVGHLLELGVSNYLLKPVIEWGEAKTDWAAVGIRSDEYGIFLERAVRCGIERSADGLDQTLRKFLLRALGDPAGWPDGCTSRSCASGRKMVVVEHDGRLSACPRFVGMRDVGATVGLRLPVLQVELAPALRSTPRECASCPWLRACGGGCTLAGQRTLADAAPVLDPQCDSHFAAFELLFREVIPRIIDRREFHLPRIGALELVESHL